MEILEPKIFLWVEVSFAKSTSMSAPAGTQL